MQDLAQHLTNALIASRVNDFEQAFSNIRSALKLVKKPKCKEYKPTVATISTAVMIAYEYYNPKVILPKPVKVRVRNYKPIGNYTNGTVGEIPLYKGKSLTTAVAYVSIEDYANVICYQWYLDPHEDIQYARASINGTQYRLHQFILGKQPIGVHIDHEDGNGLNNRRDNLRITTPQQNSYNQRKAKSNTSGYKGVSYCTTTNQWRVKVYHERKQYDGGRHATAELANEAAVRLRNSLHGEYARHE